MHAKLDLYFIKILNTIYGLIPYIFLESFFLCAHFQKGEITLTIDTGCKNERLSSFTIYN